MKTFGLIGKSLAHSFSKNYFTSKFTTQNIDAQFANFEFATELELEKFLEETDCNFCNVTIPYKEKIMPLVDVVDITATKIGAVNCIKKIDNLWHATNTDCLGFEKSFLQKIQTQHKKALVLGSGGASKAVQFVLKKNSIPYIIVSRTYILGGINYNDVTEEILQNYNIIINTTPLGTYPEVHTGPALPYHLLTSNNYLFDMVYNPIETLFLQHGKNKNATCINGLEMLELQAEASWNYWNE